jgi:hypothetical protein
MRLLRHRFTRREAWALAGLTLMGALALVLFSSCGGTTTEPTHNCTELSNTTIQCETLRTTYNCTGARYDPNIPVGQDNCFLTGCTGLCN